MGLFNLFHRKEKKKGKFDEDSDTNANTQGDQSKTRAVGERYGSGRLYNISVKLCASLCFTYNSNSPSYRLCNQDKKSK